MTSKLFESTPRADRGRPREASRQQPKVKSVPSQVGGGTNDKISGFESTFSGLLIVNNLLISKYLHQSPFQDPIQHG